MKPYFENDSVKIYHGDFKEVLPGMKAKAIITDPPFFMPATHYQSRIKHQRCWGDTSILQHFFSNACDIFTDVVEHSGHILVFCNHESFPVFYPELYRRTSYLKSIVWDKERVGLGRVWRNQHELIIAARWKESIFNDKDKKLRSDVMRFKATLSRNRRHPVEKPISLLQELIEVTTFEGDTVIDPFMGAGTTLEAACRLNRKSVGIELEERYCEKTARYFEDM